MRLAKQLIFGSLFLVLPAIVAVYVYDKVTIPPPVFDTPREVSIKRGEGLRSIAYQLREAGIVRSAVATIIYARYSSVEQKLRPGVYRFRGGERIDEVIRHLVRGDVAMVTVTVPEGLTIRDIAMRLEQAGLGCANDFEQAARSGELVRALGLPDGAEGFLFPATYKFSPRASTHTILSAMLGRFYEIDTASVEARMFERDLTLPELVTLASIIEKEAKVPDERPVIASVFDNRLRLKMPLQSDPTAMYNADGWTDSTVNAVHTPSQYNTYDFRGLPPGPIASPGLLSLNAALYPAQTDYLYFVARRDGTHVFSRSLQEHNRAVAALRKTSAQIPGANSRALTAPLLDESEFALAKPR